MTGDVEVTDEFGSWFVDLTETDQDWGRFTVELLMAQGPNLRFPHSSVISNFRHSHMRELRIQSEGRPVRVLYAFDPHRSAILLIGGDKTGDGRFYERMIPIGPYALQPDRHLPPHLCGRQFPWHA